VDIPGQKVHRVGIIGVALEAFCLMTLRWFVTELCGKKQKAPKLILINHEA